MAELPKTRVKLAKNRLQRCSSSDARLPITVMNCRRFIRSPRPPRSHDIAGIFEALAA
jgi:hypothetical protein